MTINVGKFAAFVSYLTEKTRHYFSIEDCQDMLALINNMNETVIPPQADYQTVDQLMMVMNNGTQKIEAIKLYRTLTGLGLKESKDAVEKYWKQKPFGVD